MVKYTWTIKHKDGRREMVKTEVKEGSDANKIKDKLQQKYPDAKVTPRGSTTVEMRDAGIKSGRMVIGRNDGKIHNRNTCG